MNEPENSEHTAESAHELDTTPPNPNPEAIPPPTAPDPGAGAWEMPKPVFRKSSGKLPRDFEKRYSVVGTQEIAETNTGERPTATEGISAATAAKPALEEFQGDLTEHVEPQPDLAEVIEAEPPGPVSNEKQNESGGSSSTLFMLIALVVFAAFAAIFLAVVYFLFVRNDGSSGVF